MCVKLVEDVLDRRLPRRPGSTQSEQVTIFQYWSHFESLSALVLDTYMMELTEEGGCPPTLPRPWHGVPEPHRREQHCHDHAGASPRGSAILGVGK